jgi:type I restriction enzyme, S subunit
MTKHKTVKFGDVVRQVKDKVDPQTAGLERFVAGEHMDTDNLHIRRWGDVGAGYLGPAFHMRFKPGQVLYGSRRTYLRKVAFAEFEGITANTTYVIESKDPEVLLPELLPFIMQTDSFNEHSIKQSKGSVNPYINFSDITWYEFPLPPVDEQRRIADLLWAADDSMQEYGALIQSINQMIASYRDSFFNDSHGWKKEQLGKLYEIKLGKMVSPKSRQGILPRPFMSNANVQWGRIDLAQEVKQMDFSDEEFEKNRLRYGDLLVCEGGEVGRSAIWRNELPECGYQKAIHRLRPITDDLPSEVLLQFMFYAASRGLFVKFTGQSTIAHFPAERLRLLEILVPPKESQDEFLKVLVEMENSLSAAEQHLAETKNLKLALLKKFIEGA